ncbi:MAG: hypothetical protein HC848_05125 [Limnobacter sp.]|nr:hypothetical protein [Limnobacter sp.]
MPGYITESLGDKLDSLKVSVQVLVQHGQLPEGATTFQEAARSLYTEALAIHRHYSPLNAEQAADINWVYTELQPHQ